MKNYIMLLLCVIVLSGCGARGGSAPPGSTIAIATPAAVINANPDFRADSQTLPITIKSATATGVGNASVSIEFVFTTLPDQNLISDLSSIVTLCDGTHILNTPVEMTTDDWGVYNLCILYQDGGGLNYIGNINVFSGDQTVTTTLTVAP